MLKNLGSKTLQIVLLIILTLIIAASQKYVRRLLHLPQIFETVESSDSELLGMLMDKSRFSNNWMWDSIITDQFNQLEYDPNIDELAIRKFVGYYRTGHDVRFTHTIIKYLAVPVELNADPRWDAYGVDVLIDQIVISTLEASTFQPPACYIGLDEPETEIIRCVLVRKYGNIHERIDLDVYGENTTETISQLVHNVINVVEDKETSIQ